MPPGHPAVRRGARAVGPVRRTDRTVPPRAEPAGQPAGAVRVHPVHDRRSFVVQPANRPPVVMFTGTEPGAPGADTPPDPRRTDDTRSAARVSVPPPSRGMSGVSW